MSQSFQTVSVNANGFANVMKHSAFSNIVSAHCLHAWLIAETKSQSSVHLCINIPDYKVFESPGVKADRTTSKWGVALGVTASLHSQMVLLPPQLAGRAVCIDVIIPSDSGRGFPHHLVGVYAPYNPGGAPNLHDTLHDFWDHIYHLCATAQHSWQVIGDFNATLMSSEVMGEATGNNHACTAYCHFLQQSHGIDTCEIQNDNDAHHVFTLNAYNGSCWSIIDHCVHSAHGIDISVISTPQSFMPGTDHQLISSAIVCSPPAALNASSSLSSACPQDQSPYPPCFIVPK
ncbi:uncharacterized protein EV420DRAFT_1652460 [Desarmillaria tabescens]|uniref:Endonuclease/exonuclease/phosphatase domain-containing protein n=1 Tax=Armillaria tabescens TaxID=1929756 RepID=A0AA39MK42_ARMTA|nr:uncharacterized protein EV420DRAFT_1652460 [Desarmillaria tabescens]KAK0436639.1 hypothetical protein EV420DRAFT_1652460 [Desarmillaria tabescens]